MTDKIVHLVDHGRGNLQDIPACMEAVAARIRAGELDFVAGCAVFLDADGLPTLFGWGDTNDVHSVGMLNIGSAFLSYSRAAR